MLVDRFDGCFAAQPATGTGKNVTRQVLEIDLDGRGEENIERIFRRCALETRCDFNNVAAISNQAFC